MGKLIRVVKIKGTPLGIGLQRDMNLLNQHNSCQFLGTLNCGNSDERGAHIILQLINTLSNVLSAHGMWVTRVSVQIDTGFWRLHAFPRKVISVQTMAC